MTKRHSIHVFFLESLPETLKGMWLENKGVHWHVKQRNKQKNIPTSCLNLKTITYTYIWSSSVNNISSHSYHTP